MFNSQSAQAHEQAQLYSSRYTSDTSESKAHRGFVPGKISDSLREALGVRSNQLPPFVYVMRMYGYPPGWFLEAQVRRTKLAVLDGVVENSNVANTVVKNEPADKLGDEVAAVANAVVKNEPTDAVTSKLADEVAAVANAAIKNRDKGQGFSFIL
jgi:hypothetical protein